MNKKKWSLDRVFTELRTMQGVEKNSIKGWDTPNPKLKELAKKSGWKYQSLITALSTGMYLEIFDDEPAKDSVMTYYEHRELEDRDESRSPTGFNSRGDPVELDFN